MSAIKNVAFAGASGALGKVVFEKIQNAGKFKVVVLRRLGSSATFPSDVKVVDVDYDSVDALTEVLKGQDAVVSAVGSLQVGGQTKLIDAAIAAGVKRFLPSEFGSNLDNPNTRKLPVFTFKVQIQDYLIEKAKTSGLTYTFVYNNAFLDWGLEQDFLLATKEAKPTIVEDGNITFSSTTLASVGDGVVGVLNHPEETKNRAVYIDDIKITQNQLLELAKKVAPNKPWAPQHVKLDDVTAKADERLSQGLLDMETFAPYLMRAIFGSVNGGVFEKNDNQLLGIKGVTEAEVLDIVKKYVK